MRVSPFAAALLSIAAGAAADSTHAADDLPGYHAVYVASYQGRAVGKAEFSVTLLDAEYGIYEFRSESRFRGLYRLIVPGPVEESSRFALESGRIRPLAYSLRDGTRRGRNSFSVEFDWELGRGTTTAGEISEESQLVAGMLDRGSLQVALMLLGDDFASGQVILLDRDGPEAHGLRAAGEEVLETPLGQFQTRKLIQQRQGSSRQTLIWSAPDLHGLPVRIERQRDGETRAAFHLEEVRWHE